MTPDPDTLDAVVIDVDTIPTRPVPAPAAADDLFALLDRAARFGAYVQLRSSTYPGDLERDVLRWVDQHRGRLGLTLDETTVALDHGRMRLVRVMRSGLPVATITEPVVATTARGAAS